MTSLAKTFMTTLGLKSSQGKLPCYSRVRKAYRALFKQHPDIGGVTADFQEITQAARELFQYILDHPESVEKEPKEDTTDESEDDDNIKEILKIFENSTNIKYNKDSVTYQVDKDLADEWKDTLETYFSVTATTPEKGKLLFTKKDWVIPGREKDEEGTGTVIVSLWPNTAKGKGKARMLVQGTHYFQFVTLTLPTLANTVRKHVTLQITVDDKEKADNVPGMSKKDDKEEIEDAPIKSKEEPVKKNVAVKNKVEDEVVPVKSKEEPLKQKVAVKGKKEDVPVVKQKDAVKDIEEAEDVLVKSKKEPVKQNTVVADNVTEVEEQTVNNEVEELQNHERVPEKVVDTIDRLQKALIDKCSQMDTKLTTSLEIQTEMKKQVDNLTVEVKALKASAESSKEEIKSEIREIKVTVDKFQIDWDRKVEYILETAKIVKERLDKCQDIVVKKVQANDNVENTSKEAETTTTITKEAEAVESLSKEGKGSTSKEAEDTIDCSKTPERVGEEEVAVVNKQEVIDIEAINERKVIFFHSSVAVDIDIDRFEKATKSKVEMVKTYHIEENKHSPDPELHLCNTVGDNKADNYDLVIFAVGSNDVKKTEEDETLEITEKMDNIKRQCELLVDTAIEVSSKNNSDAFIIEQIPRYESPGMTKLQKFANSYLNTLVTGSRARVHLVSQASLFRHPGEARKTIHRNNNHLTVRGLYYYNTNLINEVHNVYKELTNINIHISKPSKPPSLIKPKSSKKEAQKQTLPQYKQNQYRAPTFSAPQQPQQAAAGAWAQGPPREQQSQGPPRDLQQYQGPLNGKQQHGPPKEQQHQAQVPPREQQYQQGPPLPWEQGPYREQQYQQGPWEQLKYQGPPREQQQYKQGQSNEQQMNLAPPTKQQYQGPMVEQKYPQPPPREQQQQCPPKEWKYQQPLPRQQQPPQWEQQYQQVPQTILTQQLASQPLNWQLQQQQGHPREQQSMQGLHKVPQPYPPVCWGTTAPSPPTQHYTSAPAPAGYWGPSPSPSPPAMTNYATPFPPTPLPVITGHTHASSVPVQGGQGGYNYYSG